MNELNDFFATLADEERAAASQNCLQASKAHKQPPLNCAALPIGWTLARASSIDGGGVSWYSFRVVR